MLEMTVKRIDCLMMKLRNSWSDNELFIYALLLIDSIAVTFLDFKIQIIQQAKLQLIVCSI